MLLSEIVQKVQQEALGVGVEFQNNKVDEVKMRLYALGGFLAENIGVIEPRQEEAAIEEEKPTRPGHCQPDQNQEEQAKTEATAEVLGQSEQTPSDTKDG